MFPSARLDVANYLEISRKYWETSNQFICEKVQPTDIELEEGRNPQIPRLGITAKVVAFCTGPTNEIASMTFPGLRVRPNQGDILTLNIPNFHEGRAIHSGVWLIRQHESTFVAGATNRWTDFDPIPRESDREELKQKLEKLIRFPFEIVDHRTALRPASHDQRPLIGVGGMDKRMIVLNGLGSKGSLQAPWCAELVLNNLLDNEPIPTLLDWSRS